MPKIHPLTYAFAGRVSVYQIAILAVLAENDNTGVVTQFTAPHERKIL